MEAAKRVWEQILADMGNMTSDHASHYDHIAISAPNRLVISFRAKYNTSKSFCERQDRRTQLEESLTRALGQQVRIQFELLPGQPLAAADEQSTVVSPRQQKWEKSSHPLVRQAMELFDAQVIRLEEPRQITAAEPVGGADQGQ